IGIPFAECGSISFIYLKINLSVPAGRPGSQPIFPGLTAGRLPIPCPRRVSARALRPSRVFEVEAHEVDKAALALPASPLRLRHQPKGCGQLFWFWTLVNSR